MMEENAQMSLLPDAAVAAQMTMTGEEEIDLSEYEIVCPEFFAHIKEPALTVNVDKIGVNTACVRLMPDVEYVQILVNRKEKKLLLKPCDEIEITGYRWGRTKDGKRYPSQRTGELFVLTLCEIMDWKLDLRVNEHTELEIFAEENPPKRVNRPEACGLRHLAFCVDSVEQMVRELAEVGIECEPIRVDDYTGKKMTFFHDPDGLPLELHE